MLFTLFWAHSIPTAINLTNKQCLLFSYLTVQRTNKAKYEECLAELKIRPLKKELTARG